MIVGVNYSYCLMLHILYSIRHDTLYVYSVHYTTVLLGRCVKFQDITTEEEMLVHMYKHWCKLVFGVRFTVYVLHMGSEAVLHCDGGREICTKLAKLTHTHTH